MAQKKEKKQITTKDDSFDFADYKKEVIAGLMSGKSLTGEEGLLKPLIANFVEGALDAELEDHLQTERNQGISNRRNGNQSKQIRTEAGEIEIHYDLSLIHI